MFSYVELMVSVLWWLLLPQAAQAPASCEMIILRNNSHGGIMRVCMGIFTTALRYKIIRQILKKNTSPYFHSVSLVIWPLTLMKRTHFSEFSIFSRFSTYIRKAQGWTLRLSINPYLTVEIFPCSCWVVSHSFHVKWVVSEKALGAYNGITLHK